MRIEIDPFPLRSRCSLIQYGGTVFIKCVQGQEYRFNKGVLYSVSGSDAIYDELLSGGEFEMDTNMIVTWLTTHVALNVSVPVTDKLIEEFFDVCK
jgi:hypothetical protein